MKKYSVNPSAEKVLNGVATTVLIIGWILAIVITVSLAIFSTHNFNDYNPIGLIIVSLLGGGITLLLFYIIWAELKVIINISRSLYNIQDELENLKADRNEAVE